MRKHILIEKAFIYETPKTNPDMSGYVYNGSKGYWTDNDNKPSIEDALFAAPRTKKCDVETGEDRKGE